MSEEEKKAIEDIKRELTDLDRREYMSNWFANDLDIIVNIIEKQNNRLEQLEKENEQLEEIEKEHQKLNGELRKENKELADYLKDEHYVPATLIRAKIEELGEKQKATKDMCKSLALSTARTTLAELIGLDNMVNLFLGCDTLIKLTESGGSNE